MVKVGDINDILALMEAQDQYINHVNKIVNVLYADLNMINNSEFLEFASQFQQFTRYHSSSQGFTRAIATMQIFHHALLEKLLDCEIILAAEYLDQAADCLELSAKDAILKSNFYLIKLKNDLDIVEENQLKLLERMEELLKECYQEQLEN